MALYSLEGDKQEEGKADEDGFLYGQREAQLLSDHTEPKQLPTPTKTRIRRGRGRPLYEMKMKLYVTLNHKTGHKGHFVF